MCGGGGGGGAADAAQEAENLRQKVIGKNVADINGAYANRQPQYDAYSNALRNKYNTELGVQQTMAGNKLKFSGARSGLTGGSAALDAGKEFQREATQGAIGVENQVQGQEAKLKSADELARTNMINLAQTGNDIGDAATQTGNALRANLQNATSEGNAQGLGDIFGNTAATYKAQQDAAAFRKGLGSVYGKPWGVP